MLLLKNKTKIKILLLSTFTLIVMALSAQAGEEYQKIELTFNKTSSIVFSATITAVDRGSRDVLAQKVKGVNNVLQLKAAKVNFKETNLTVITADGRLHQFFVRYAESPVTFTIQAHETGTPFPSTSPPIQFKADMTPDEMEGYARKILKNPEKKRLKSASHFDMKLVLQGIYIRENTMYYHLKISNHSNIPFHTDMLRFSVRDKQKVKRTASQEIEEKPLYHAGNSEVIKGQTSEELVYAIPKFTIPDAKILAIELMEKRGGRHLRVAIKNKSIMKARPVPVYP